MAQAPAPGTTLYSSSGHGGHSSRSGWVIFSGGK
jgi:hypothetical protein